MKELYVDFHDQAVNYILTLSETCQVIFNGRLPVAHTK
jgi:hypothetical protein